MHHYWAMYLHAAMHAPLSRMLLTVLSGIFFIEGSSVAQTTISVSATTSRCPNNGTITVTILNGSGPFIYELTLGPSAPAVQNSSDTTYTFSSLAAGTYVVQVTDQVPTILTDTITVTGNYTTPVLSFSKTGTTCPNDSTGGFTVHVTGGLQPMTYQITAPSAFATGWLTDSLFSNLPANTYTVAITDSCGTIQTANVTVNSSYDNFEPNAQFTIISCDSIQWNVTVPEHGEPPFTYQMTAPFTMGPQSSGIFTVPDSITSYSFQVMDACGETETVTRNINQALNVSAASFSCDSATLTASTSNFYGNPVQYMVLRGLDTLLISPIVNLTIGAGTYTVYAFNECGDTLTSVYVFTPGSISIVNIDVDIADCYLGMAQVTITINGNGGLVTFAFLSGPPSFPLPDPIITSNASVTYDSLMPGTYVYFVTDTCGLSDTLSFNVQDSLEASLSVTHTQGCAPNSEKIKAHITSNIDPDWLYSYVKLDSSGLPIGNWSSSNTSGNFNNLSGGTYVIRVRSEDCPGLYYYDTISFASYVPLAILALEGLMCNDSSLTIIASASGGATPYSYEIIQGPMLVAPQSSPTFSNLPYGSNYRVRVLDSCGNAIVQDISPSLLNVLAPNLQDSSLCLGANYSVDLVLLGGVTYEWFDNTGNPMSAFDIQNASVADSGNYVLIITVPGCDTLVDSININILNPPVADAGLDTNGICAAIDSAWQIMNANTPGSGEWGYWTVNNPPVGYNLYIVDSTDPQTMITGDASQTYELVWILDNGSCQSTDTVILDFDCTILLGMDDIRLFIVGDQTPELLVRVDHPENFQQLELQQQRVGQKRFLAVHQWYAPFDVPNILDEIAPENDVYYRMKGYTYSGDYKYSNVVGSNAHPQRPNVTLYPNPAIDYFELDLGGYSGVYPVAVQMFNVQGQQTILLFGNENELRLDTSDLPEGIYFVTVVDGENLVLHKSTVMVSHR